MKKQIYFLVSLLALIGFSSNVMAQSKGITPYLGATHTYNVDFHTGSSYAWTVYVDDLNTLAPSEAYEKTETVGTEKATATIKWTSSASTTKNYFVKVVETAAGGTGCTNTKIIKVNPQASQFYVEISQFAANACYDGDVAISLSSNEPVYTHGKATLTYKVKATNPQGSWKFNVATLVSPVVTGKAFTSPVTINSASSGVAAISGSEITVTSGTSEITLNVTVTKTATENNADDAAGTAANFECKLTVSEGASGAGFTISDKGTGTKEGTTIVARPTTTNITTEE